MMIPRSGSGQVRGARFECRCFDPRFVTGHNFRASPERVEATGQPHYDGGTYKATLGDPARPRG